MNPYRNGRFNWFNQSIDSIWETYFPRLNRLFKSAAKVPQLEPPGNVNGAETNDDLRIARSPLKQIEATVGSLHSETGGILFADKQGIVRQFIFDSGAATGEYEYTPDTDALNRVILALKQFYDYDMIGVVHSHPVHFTRLSRADIELANVYYSHNPRLKRLWLPIVQSRTTGAFSMTAYVFHRPMPGEYALPKLVAIREVEDDCR